MSVFATKDGIENIFLRFDKNPARYQAGDCLSGKIIVECGLTTPVKGIKVCSTSIKKLDKVNFTNLITASSFWSNEHLLEKS